MKPVHHINRAWRGVVVDGEVVAWPTLILEHRAAFATVSGLDNYTARWRQWSPWSAPEFDDGASYEDKQKVMDFLRRVKSVPGYAE